MMPSTDTLKKKSSRFISVRAPMILTIAEAQMIMRFRMMQKESLAIVEIGADGFPKSWDVREVRKEMPTQ